VGIHARDKTRTPAQPFEIPHNKDAVVAKYATAATDGKVYQVEYFNLDAIISVGIASTMSAEPS